METSSIVRVISQEIIKPSSETPLHLRNLKLSVLDRLQSPVYIPLIFFYQANELLGLTSSDTDHAKVSKKLKRSLSDTLTSFYPLARELDRDTFMVNCKDGGVTYVEARVDARVSDVIQDPTIEQLKLYLPISTSNVVDNNLLAVQINFFDCGGIAVGMCLSHLIGDGLSALMFMNSWGATCRGKVGETPSPSFYLADHFPDTDNGRKHLLAALAMPEKVFATKRVVFDKEKLAALREAATSSESSNIVKDPTRVELVSAFIWKHFAQDAISKKLDTKITMASQAVNLRKRMIPPPCLQNVFGNFFMSDAAIFGHDRGYPKIHDLVLEFRNLFRSFSDERIRKLQSKDEHVYVSIFNKGLDQPSLGEAEFCAISNWCRFPAYEVDYGWGKLIWVCTTGFSLLNSIVLMDTREGGIEAYISALPDHIRGIESHGYSG